MRSHSEAEPLRPVAPSARKRPTVSAMPVDMHPAGSSWARASAVRPSTIPGSRTRCRDLSRTASGTVVHRAVRDPLADRVARFGREERRDERHLGAAEVELAVRGEPALCAVELVHEPAVDRIAGLDTVHAEELGT